MSEARPATAGWRDFLLASGAALALVAAAELVLTRLAAYPPPLREVEDAVADLRRSDPTVLVIGSSHARSFDSVGAELTRRTNGHESVLSVPVEYGKLASYLWVFRHRLVPLLDERDSGGVRRRTGLRHAILVTEWWDSCEANEGPVAYNLPARAWTFRDFAADVGRHGVTTFNRNYLTNRWTEWWEGSLLVRDRGHGLLLGRIRAAVRPVDASVKAALLEGQVLGWQAMVEKGDACLGSPRQMAALDSLLQDLSGRGVSTTVLLYPRKPNTLTATARTTTLARFAALAAQHAAANRALFVDLTEGTPLGDSDFAADFDHVTATGNHKFAQWVLDGPLSTLVDSTVPRAAAAGDGPA